jgi:hypothetical protein
LYAKRPLFSAEGCHTRPDHSAEQFAEDRSALKEEGHFEAIFPGQYYPRIFFKANVTTRYKKKVVRKFRYM